MLAMDAYVNGRPVNSDEPVELSSDSSDSEFDEPEQKESNQVSRLVDCTEELTLIDDEADLLIPPPPLPELDEDYGEPEAYGEEEGEGEAEDNGGVVLNLSTPSQLTSNTSEHVPSTQPDPEKPKKKKKKKKKWLYMCTINCKYDSVRRACRRYGFKEVAEDEDWNLYWTDFSVILERVMDMKRYQKINHFPGMSEICRKDSLARNMNRMLKLFPKEYNVFPRSWCLPADAGDFQAFVRQKKNKTYILKPESGCQGKGIWVTKNPRDIKPNVHMLCQQYISKPFLVDGFKFDLRIYALVTACDPLRIFVFKEGLARFATTKYSEPTNNNCENVFMHLTNYAINKMSDDFIRDDEAGSKRRITTTNRWMRDNHYDVDKLWRDIDDVIIKTLIAAHATLRHNYRTCFPNHIKGSACFEILGFDVMLDKKLKPYLIEVNHSPSFHTDAKLDKEIKEALLYDSIALVNFGAIDKKKCVEEDRRKIKERLFQRQNKKESKEEQDRMLAKWLVELEKYEDEHMGNFRRIYPVEGSEKYDKYFHSSGSLYQETAAFKARSECARQQREEIMRKQEKLESMLRRKKDVRPESPGGVRKRRVKRPSIPTRRFSSTRCSDEYRPFARDLPSVIEPVASDLPSIITPVQDEMDLEEYSHYMDREYRVHYTLARSSKSYGSLLSGRTEDVASLSLEPIDTKKPLDIVEEEELERISSLLQRENLVKGLGIVEHVYRLLHCTPGTMSMQAKTDLSRFQQMDILGVKPERHINLSTLILSSSNIDIHPPPSLPVLPVCLPVTRRGALRNILSPIHITSMPVSRGLSVPPVTRSPQRTIPRMLQPIIEQHTCQGPQAQPLIQVLSCDEARKRRLENKYNAAEDMMNRMNQLSMEHYNNYSYNNNNPLATTAGLPTYKTQPTHPQSLINTHNSHPWKTSRVTGSISHLSSFPGQQNRGRYGPRKASRPAQASLSETDTRHGVTYEEAERNKFIYGRHGYEARSDSASSARLHQSGSPAQRSRDGSKITPRSSSLGGMPVSTPPPQLSAPSLTASNVYQYNFPNVVKVAPQQGSHSLSVVSAPAPVVHRPELAVSAGAVQRAAPVPVQQQTIEGISGLRSTKSQRIRGASNNIRMKQLEMRENHAVVFS